MHMGFSETFYFICMGQRDGAWSEIRETADGDLCVWVTESQRLRESDGIIPEGRAKEN
jgi:hypothetical protein